MPHENRRTSLAGIARLLLMLMFLSPAFAQQPDTIDLQSDNDAKTLLQQAQSLIAANKSGQAYTLLAAQEATLAGQPYFDYLLGVAALDSGRPSEAIFSLQRSLAVAPDYSGARLELARAYFETGDNALARPLFVELQSENPPPAVSSVIDSYVAAIDGSQRKPTKKFIPYVELFGGYDDNANGSTSDQDFLGFMLSPQNVQTSSPFAQVAAGFDWFVPTSSKLMWVTGMGVSYRSNPDADFVDAGAVIGRFGLNWQNGGWFGRLTADGLWASRDGDYNESYVGLDAMVGRQLGDHWDMTLDVRGGGQRFRDTLEVLDVDRVLYSLGASYRFDNSARLSFQAIGGEDSEVEVGSPYGNSRVGGRITLSAPLGSQTLLYSSIGNLTTDYDGLFFGSAREDSQLNAYLQVEFRNVWIPGLSIVPRIRYIDNDSDIDLYKYDRTEIGVIIRWAAQ